MRAAELAAATRAGVSSVIALLRHITESQRGGVNRSTQLKYLAQWVFDAADEDAAHALMSAAFNLRLARHVGGVHDDSDLISTRLSWLDAPGVEVAMTLFRRGRRPARACRNAWRPRPGSGPSCADARPGSVRRSVTPRSTCSARARTTGCLMRPRPGCC